MSLMLVRATSACNVILNDNGTFRLKADRVLRRMAKENTKHVNFLRCRVDLKDFSIGGAVAALGNASEDSSGAEQGKPSSPCVPQDVVGIGKHLCGVATDWALRSLFSQSGFVLKGFCLAPCCHQRCQWDEYVGKEELVRLGLCQREIELMFWMGSVSSISSHGESMICYMTCFNERLSACSRERSVIWHGYKHEKTS